MNKENQGTPITSIADLHVGDLVERNYIRPILLAETPTETIIIITRKDANHIYAILLRTRKDGKDVDYPAHAAAPRAGSPLEWDESSFFYQAKIRIIG